VGATRAYKFDKLCTSLSHARLFSAIFKAQYPEVSLSRHTLATIPSHCRLSHFPPRQRRNIFIAHYARLIILLSATRLQEIVGREGVLSSSLLGRLLGASAVVDNAPVMLLTSLRSTRGCTLHHLANLAD